MIISVCSFSCAIVQLTTPSILLMIFLWTSNEIPAISSKEVFWDETQVISVVSIYTPKTSKKQ